MNLLKTIFGSHDHHLNLDYTKLIIQFRNCKLLYQNQLIDEDLWVLDGKILDPEKVFFEEKKQSDVQIDCYGLTLAPGFIDTQINGAFGHDFTYEKDKINESIGKVAKRLLSHGVTAFCPTIVSSEASVYQTILPSLKITDGGVDGAAVLGAHLEGPFIAQEKVGAHEFSCLRKLDNGVEDVLKVYGDKLDNVRIVTLAAELDMSGAVTEYLNKKGVVVSIGHSIASLEEGENCIKHGAKYITHLFNAMLPFHHRDPHLFGLLSNRELSGHVYYGIIADGIHTHFSALNMSYKTHPNGLVLVTDAVSAMGLPEGAVHYIGNQKVEVQSKNRAIISGTNTLCGSITPLNEGVKNLIQAAGCGIVEALKCASEHPAKLLGIYPNKGSLNYGTDADFVVLDSDVSVYATFIAGDLVWYTEQWTPKFQIKNLHKV